MSLIALWIILKILFWIGLAVIVLFFLIGTSDGREFLGQIFTFIFGLGIILLVIVGIGAGVVYFLLSLLGIV
jgi:polyferredoxin